MSKNKKLLPTILLAFLLLSCGAAGFGDDMDDDIIDAEMLVQESANYATVDIKYGDYTKQVSSSGYKAFVVEQNLYMKEGSARMSDTHFIRNEAVKAGDVLVTYEKHGSRAELERRELELNRCREDYEIQKRAMLRSIADMRQELAGLENEYDLRIKRLEVQKAQLDYERYVYRTEHSMCAQLREIDELKEFYADCQIVAPFDGVITWITNKNSGDTIYAGETLVTLQSQERYLIGLDNSSGHFRYGMRVSVGLGPRNKKEYVDGRIIAAANILPNENKLPYALVELYGEASERGLKNIQVTGNEVELGHVLILPRRAITFDSGKSYISLLDGNMVQKRIVVSGHNTSGDTWALQGLEAGQQVIID